MRDKRPAEGAFDDYPLMHPWNDPDNDGHDCADCPSDSIWKCDKFAHDEAEAFRADVMRAMRETQQETAPVLAEMQKVRRKALDDSLHKGLM